LKRSGFETEQHIGNLNIGSADDWPNTDSDTSSETSPKFYGGVGGNSAKFGLVSPLRHTALQMEQHIANLKQTWDHMWHAYGLPKLGCRFGSPYSDNWSTLFWELSATKFNCPKNWQGKRV